eukprot:COSAG02_NODE_48184_length_335_cov_1.203390_1_plen_88_part_01
MVQRSRLPHPSGVEDLLYLVYRVLVTLYKCAINCAYHSLTERLFGPRLRVDRALKGVTVALCNVCKYCNAVWVQHLREPLIRGELSSY